MFKFRGDIRRFGLWQKIKKWLGFGYYISTFYHNDYKVGDRVGQLIVMPYPEVNFVEAEELSKSDRGAGGYGSTGR